MPVPTLITELSPIAGDNSPLGSESPVILDNIQRAHAAFIAQLYADREMPGVVKHYAGASAPAGWLACTGQAVSRTTYAALFAAIGTTWGAGNGTTTFNLPPADRMLMGAGGLYAVGATGGSRDAIVVGHGHVASSGGQSVDHFHSGATSINGEHSHNLTLDNTTGGGVSTQVPKWSALNSPTTTSTATTSSAGNHAHSFTTGGVSSDHTHAVYINETGSSGANANLPPYAAMLLIIKT